MQAQVISFHCVVKDRLGRILSTSFNRDVINQRGADKDRLTALVDGLQHAKTGEKRRILISARDAYGEYDANLVIELDRSDFEPEARLKVGSQVLRRDGEKKRRVFYVTQLIGDRVILDGNHPFAGEDLVFEVEIVSARVAQAEDLLDLVEARACGLLH